MTDHEPYRRKNKITELDKLRTGTTYQVVDIEETPYNILYDGEVFPEAINVYENNKRPSVFITECIFSVYR